MTKADANKPDPRAGADQARSDADVKAKSQTANNAEPKTDDVDHLAPLSGADRSGLGAKGWAEVPADGIGGHPELEITPKTGADGDLNGPQPRVNPKTGAPADD